MSFYVCICTVWRHCFQFDAVIRGTEADRLLGGHPTFVLDCIDDINTKAELISYCVKNKLPMLTSMGAGSM